MNVIPTWCQKLILLKNISKAFVQDPCLKMYLGSLAISDFYNCKCCHSKVAFNSLLEIKVLTLAPK